MKQRSTGTCPVVAAGGRRVCVLARSGARRGHAPSWTADVRRKRICPGLQGRDLFTLALAVRHRRPIVLRFCHIEMEWPPERLGGRGFPGPFRTAAVVEVVGRK